jgi:hypothetical protein
MVAMEKYSLFKHDSQQLTIEVTTYLDDNENLVVQGIDKGEEVKTYFDNELHEYSLSVPSSAFQNLKSSLGKKLNNSRFFTILKKRFSGYDSFNRIKQYLENNKIPYTNSTPFKH